MKNRIKCIVKDFFFLVDNEHNNDYDRNDDVDHLGWQ